MTNPEQTPNPSETAQHICELYNDDGDAHAVLPIKDLHALAMSHYYQENMLSKIQGMLADSESKSRQKRMEIEKILDWKGGEL